MQTYETLFITTPTLTEDEERTAVETLSQIVTDGGGSFVANERLGRRRLAYPIRKHNDGVYVRFLYDAEPAVPKELERRIRLSDQILRVLTVRLDGNWATFAKEQAVRDAQAREEAAERERLERERAEQEAAEAGSSAEAASTDAGDESASTAGESETAATTDAAKAEKEGGSSDA